MMQEVTWVPTQPTLHFWMAALATKVREGRCYSPLVFHGGLGVGKSTYADIFILSCMGFFELNNFQFPRQPDTNNPDVIKVLSRKGQDILHVDANTLGIDDIRDNLLPFLHTTPTEWDRKYLIVKNADRLSPQAQDTLLKVFEEGRKDILTILLTTDFEGIVPAIRGRCVHTDFSTPSHDLALQIIEKNSKHAPLKDVLGVDSIQTLSEGSIWHICSMGERLDALLDTGCPDEIKDHVERLMKSLEGQKVGTRTQGINLFLRVAFFKMLGLAKGNFSYALSLAKLATSARGNTLSKMGHWAINDASQLQGFFQSLYAIRKFHKVANS